MVENQPGQESKDDDFDLMNLVRNAFSFFRKYGRRLVIFSITGMLTGFLLFKITPNLYESTLLLHTSTLTNTEQINIIENWNDLLKNGEYTVLAEHFNCNPDILKNVVKISAAEIQKSYVPNNPNAFIVTAIVKDNTVLDSLSYGLIYGFENNDYIKAKLDSKRSNLTSLIDKVKIEISKLDSTKKSIAYNINNSSQHSSSFIIDISTINGQMITLNEKLLTYQDELKFAHAVEVFHKFEKFEKPLSPKLFKLMVLGFIAGFAMGYLLSVFSYLKKKIVLTGISGIDRRS
jgi:hypothetical protein